MRGSITELLLGRRCLARGRLRRRPSSTLLCTWLLSSCGARGLYGPHLALTRPWPCLGPPWRSARGSGVDTSLGPPSPFRKTMATVKPGPLTGLAGSGGPDFFRVLNLAGWVKDWNPRDGTYGEKGLLVAEATPNPALVLGLGPAATEAQVQEACSAFGHVENVFIPAGAGFAFVQFKSDADAATCCAELNSVQGGPVRVQPAKQASAELAAWRRSLLGVKSAVDAGC